MKLFAQILSFLSLTAALQPLAWASETTQRPPATSYSVVVSNLEGSDVFVTAISQNFFSFKYCDSSLKNSASQELIDMNVERARNPSFFADAAQNKMLAEKLFTNPNCHLVGKASYAFVKDFRNDADEIYIKSYGWLTGPSEWVTLLTSLYSAKQAFNFSKKLRSARAKTNTENLIATLKSPGLKKNNLRLAIVSTLGIAASSLFTYELNRQNDDLELLITNALNSQSATTIIITEESLPDYLKRIKHAIDLSVEEGNLRAF